MLRLPRLLSRPHFALILTAVVMAGLVILLISRNYLAQVELQKSAMQNLKQGLEKHAAAVSYFYAERQNDLKNLAQSREIAIYFENQALGMSMAYGLGASLWNIQRELDRLRAERRLAQDRIYHSLNFISNTGERLATSLVEPDKKIAPDSWRRFLDPGGAAPEIRVESLEGELQVVISTPYFLRGAIMGKLLLW